MVVILTPIVLMVVGIPGHWKGSLFLDGIGNQNILFHCGRGAGILRLYP